MAVTLGRWEGNHWPGRK